MRTTILCAGKSHSIIIALSVILLLLLAVPSGLIAETSSKSKSKSSATSSKSSKSKSDEDSPKKERDDKSGGEDEEEPEPKPAPKPAETPTIITPENLGSKLSDILAPASKSAAWGVKVMYAETGQSLFESQSDNLFIPASNRKLFTGALALDQLGPDFVYQTFLYYTGNLDSQGNLNGNLVIVPSGDPTFSTTLYQSAQPDWVFRDWAQKVQAAGIKSVKGDMLIDCSNWDMNDITPRGWATRVLNDGYAPQTSPLTINENLCNIIVTPGKSGTPAAVSFIPPATGYPVSNSTVSGKDGTLRVNRVLNTKIEVSGNVSSKRTIWSRPIDRPTLFAAANFRHHLLQAQIPVQGSVRIVTNKGVIPARNNTNTIAMVQSPKLTEIINYMMKRSDNHIAEQIYVSISAAKLGKGSYTNSQQLEAQLLAKAQIDPRSIHCVDGSGLSETNKVSPAQICNLLTYMRSHQYAQQYYDCMAISGRDGTLRNRMGGIAGRVHAKTGTINGVKTLSGYLSISPTKTISFSFLVNQIRGGSISSTQDRLCNTIANLVL